MIWTSQCIYPKNLGDLIGSISNPHPKPVTNQISIGHLERPSNCLLEPKIKFYRFSQIQIKIWVRELWSILIDVGLSFCDAQFDVGLSQGLTASNASVNFDSKSGSKLKFIWVEASNGFTLNFLYDFDLEYLQPYPNPN